MSIRLSLLAILDQGACYGYQLRAEFERRTGGTWPLNVGQIYNTLDRLERDGLVTKNPTTDEGHVYFRITGAGRATATQWLDAPVERTDAMRDELAIKLVLAATLPGTDMPAIIAQQRAHTEHRLAMLRADRPAAGGPDEDLPERLVADALLFRTEAEARWLDHVEQELRSRAPEPWPLRSEPPKRGRPARLDRR